MYIPAGLLFVLMLWFFIASDNRPLPGWLCAVGLIAFAVYAPAAGLIVGALLVLILIPVGLFFLYAAGIHLLEKGAKALPACWLFDGSAGPPALPAPRGRRKDDGPACNDYHSFDGWIEAYQAWETGKPIPFNAHNKSWRYGDDSY